MAKEPEQKPDRIVEQSTRFAKTKRKLHAKAQLALDDQVKKLVEDPLLGAPKTGALAGVRVVKLKADRQQWLLAYEFHARRNAIELLDLGSHENFYRDLQNYLADRP
jgi:mRNA-degrading endonuclease YafQ of YafQ-DinJ toxin-antitoxin module